MTLAMTRRYGTPPLLILYTARPLSRMEWHHLAAYPDIVGAPVKRDDHICALAVRGPPFPHQSKLIDHLLDCRSLRSSTPWQYGDIAVGTVHSEQELLMRMY